MRDRRWVAFGVTACAVAATVGAGGLADAHDRTSPVAVIDYDSHSLYEYGTKWDNTFGPGEMANRDTREVTKKGVFTVSAVPFTVGADFSVFDHLKYIAISHDSFPVPEVGSLEFGVDIRAKTPGTQPGRVIEGCYYSDPATRACTAPYAKPALEGQQAGVVLNMVNFETGQLFDWFVSSNQVFALIERLPSNVTNPALAPGDPSYVGLDQAYTQIVKVATIKPGKTQHVSIRFTRNASQSFVEYFLNDKLFVRVDDIGIPLDLQGTAYSGIYPSFPGAVGEDLTSQLDSFVIGHGLFSLLDEYPFQHPEADGTGLNVTIPLANRLFGQGAVGEFSNFTVTARTG